MFFIPGDARLMLIHRGNFPDGQHPRKEYGGRDSSQQTGRLNLLARTTAGNSDAINEDILISASSFPLLSLGCAGQGREPALTLCNCFSFLYPGDFNGF